MGGYMKYNIDVVITDGGIKKFENIEAVDEVEAKRVATRRFLRTYGGPASFCSEGMVVEEVGIETKRFM